LITLGIGDIIIAQFNNFLQKSPMRIPKTFYEILGVHPTATQALIQATCESRAGSASLEMAEAIATLQKQLLK
jgi:hypothetical protein